MWKEDKKIDIALIDCYSISFTYEDQYYKRDDCKLYINEVSAKKYVYIRMP